MANSASGDPVDLLQEFQRLTQELQALDMQVLEETV